ncbi:MAG: hypothetical protein K5795_04335 [Lachnospiraceae bacterium]|nr:hypothetical protein [Lachnospiraceae bacterium]
MSNILFVGFKGKNNISGMLAEQLSSEHLLLTNSFGGLKKDVDSISKEYDHVIMFGIDKTLVSKVRIENAALVAGEKRVSGLNTERIAESLNAAGISTVISDDPTAYLCNEAYWHVLKKFSGRAVFIHIPTLKHVDESFFERMKLAFCKRQ